MGRQGQAGAGLPTREERAPTVDPSPATTPTPEVPGGTPPLATPPPPTPKATWAGRLLVFGPVVFVLLMLAEESLRPDYSPVHETMSALGVGHYAWMFNLGVLFHGTATLVAALLLWQVLTREPITRFSLVLMAAGAVSTLLVAIFPANHPIIHYLVASAAFFFGGVACVVFGFGSSTWEEEGSPYPLFAVAAGVVSLVAFWFYLTSDFGPLGRGGMERLALAPILLWVVVLGVRLLARRVPLAETPLGIPQAPASG